jgi:Mg-chelatase subunit ChlD
METQTTTPETTFSIGKIETPKQFAQLGLLVVDGSGSMGEHAAGNISKAQATNNSIRELFTRFKASRVAKNFTFGMITFDDSSAIRLQPTDVGPALDDNGDYNPLNGHGGGTRIFAALETAEKMANDFIAAAPAGGVPHSALILVMSDGCCSDPAQTKAVAARIKSGPNAARVKICSTLFATIGRSDAAGEALLKEIASDPVMGYKTVYDGETLRGFFERSISAASGGIQIV